MSETENDPAPANHKVQVLGALENYFRRSVFLAFYWIMFGVCGIYGFRLYHDAPLHPSFMPIVLVSYSVVTAFIVVLTLNSVVGEIKFKAPGFEFEGASGPIVLWIACFLAIAFSLSALYEDEHANDSQNYQGKSLSEIVSANHRERDPNN